MKSTSEKEFLGFWSYMTKLSVKQLTGGGLYFSSVGFYCEREPKAIYLFTNFLSGTKVLMGNEENINLIRNSIQEDKITAKEILNLDHYKDYELTFDDIDLFLEQEPNMSINNEGLVLNQISEDHKQAIDTFYQKLTEDEVDTLDLSFEGDLSIEAWAVWEDDRIVAIARYTVLPTKQGMMDLTVVTDPAFRGRGFATVLIHKLITLGLKNNYIPRYRVKSDNVSSMKVAEKLGFKPYCNIQAILKKEELGDG